MVYFRGFDINSPLVYFDTRLVESQGRGMVHASGLLSSDFIYIRTADTSSFVNKTVSIVICTYGRPDSLNETLVSLTKQTYKDFEVLLITEKGNLSELRQRGLERAGGSIVSFIDDDVYCPPTWLEGVVKSFREGVVGVSGPTTITEEYQKNRDCLRFRLLKRINDWVFKVPTIPGHLSPCGAPTMASNYDGCSFEGNVEYLEACNMSVLKKESLDAGGFDPVYIGTGEWSEPDLSLKLKKKGSLKFTPYAGLYHRPSKQGIYKARLATDHRWRNFMVFQRRWVNNSLRTYLYRGFVWVYFILKTNRMI